MAGSVGLQGSREVARATGRCFGSLFFSIFGGVWLLLGVYVFGRLAVWPGVLIAAVVAAYVVSAVRLLSRAGKRGEGAYPEAERRRNDNRFYAINAVQGVLIFAALSTLPRLGRQDLAIAVAALIVGLHFFPMPPLYRARANLVTGAAMVVWTIGCMIRFRGDRMIAWVALGSGLILWGSALAALRTARQLLASAAL